MAEINYLVETFSKKITYNNYSTNMPFYYKINYILSEIITGAEKSYNTNTIVTDSTIENFEYKLNLFSGNFSKNDKNIIAVYNKFIENLIDSIKVEIINFNNEYLLNLNIYADTFEKIRIIKDFISFITINLTLYTLEKKEEELIIKDDSIKNIFIGKDKISIIYNFNTNIIYEVRDIKVFI